MTPFVFITLQMLMSTVHETAEKGYKQLDTDPQQHGMDIEDCILVTLTVGEEWVGAE
jgi:hypothetical protein